MIGFDKSCAVFQKEKGLRPVDYVRKKPVFDANWKQGLPEMADYEDQLVWKKNDEWRYERELRQIFSLASLTTKPLTDSTLGYFLSIPPSAVVSVTLVPKGAPQLESEVRQMLQNPLFSHVKLDRAILSKNDFSLYFRLVP